MHCVKCVFTKRNNKLKPAGKQQEYESLVAAEDLFGNKRTVNFRQKFAIHYGTLFRVQLENTVLLRV